jgi:protein-S-isoprenylcysteine O-methyltransferase Ste14
VKKRIFPPSYLNFLLIIEILVHWFIPIFQIIHEPYSYIGIGLIVLSLVLNIYSVRYLERQNTTSNFYEKASRLIVTGPFRLSRNPIYLSGVGLSFGIAIFLGSLTPFFFSGLLFILLNSIHIPDEEMRLEQEFGEGFRMYKLQVRRWI